MKIEESGETEIIGKIWSKLGRENENEDVHFLDDRDSYLILAMDSINEGIHFLRNWDPAKVGKFLVDINMSDVISKNGEALEMMASFSLPRELEFDWLDSFMEGVFKELERFNVAYAGGDLKEGKYISLTGLIIGKVKKGQELRRRPIYPGSYIYITDKIGKQYQKYLDFIEGKSEGDRIIEVNVSYDKIKRIMGLKPTACMDDSDGPFKSLRILSELNHVRIDLKDNVCESSNFEECYSFGGDYELIFASKTFTTEFPMLGIASQGIGVYDFDGKPIIKRGYEHFIFNRLK